MTPGRKLAIVICSAVLFLAGSWAWRVFQAWRDIPAAYAAWDAGTILVAYLEEHDGRWPAGWVELSGFVQEHDPPLFLRGGVYPPEDNHADYLRTLRETVAIDWNFDPAADANDPVRGVDGGPLPTLWEDPNQMVREYLQSRRLDAEE